MRAPPPPPPSGRLGSAWAWAWAEGLRPDKNILSGPRRSRVRRDSSAMVVSWDSIFAMFVNFGLAKERGGCCYLRFDDTNPEAEKKEDINHIEEIVNWMGWAPFKFTPHPHAGDKWCIYPTYDFAHCIVDSLENITHSVCPLSSSVLLNSKPDGLHITGYYIPLISTCRMYGNIHLNYIVTNKHIDGWDDPRLLTLAGLRRRGVTPTAINAFVVITNLESDKVMELDSKRWPDAQNDDPSAFYKVPFSRVVYIDQSDFRMKDSKGYYGLAPGKSVLLRYGFPIKCTNVVFADDNETIRVRHWVAESSPGKEPIRIEVRLFEKLLNSENPAKLNDKWLTDINPNSKVVVSDAYGGSILKDAVVGDRFQFERLGYFAVDKDSEPGKLVFNRTVTLRDSYGKGGK
uniref:glutamine--tRNA ligase n=1 Tax=Brassica oleracea var. oleracea TaxID=109376 RepID=A0A0D3BI55_BRAOL